MQTQSSLDAQKFHGQRVEARQAEREGGRPKTKFSRFDDLFFAALLLDVVAQASYREPASQERIDPIDEVSQPPLFRFWEKLNARLRAAGKPDADYGTAKRAFEGGATPEGALTFIGKKWDGLRAVPVSTYHQDKIAYHGEFREVSDNGTVWRTVHNKNGPISYISPEVALCNARLAREHSKTEH